MSEIKRVWMYLRSASPEQAEMSFQEQKKTLLEYCKKKHYEIVGGTASVTNHLTAHEVRKMANCADRKGGVDLIVASNMSRFTRRTDELTDIVAAAHERGIGVKIAKIESRFDRAFIQAIVATQRELNALDAAEAMVTQEIENIESSDFGMKME